MDRRDDLSEMRKRGLEACESGETKTVPIYSPLMMMMMMKGQQGDIY